MFKSAKLWHIVAGLGLLMIAFVACRSTGGQPGEAEPETTPAMSTATANIRSTATPPKSIETAVPSPTWTIEEVDRKFDQAACDLGPLEGIVTASEINDLVLQISGFFIPVYPNDSVEIGYRNKNGQPTEQIPFCVKILAPNGTVSVVASVLVGDEWAFLYYPDNFEGASSSYLGTYVVSWESDFFFEREEFEVVASPGTNNSLTDDN